VSSLSLKQSFIIVQLIGLIAVTSAYDSHAYEEAHHFDLQSRGLRGPINNVITRSPFFVITEAFDRAGRLAEVITDTKEKRLGWPSRAIYHYGEFGKPDFITTHDPDGVLERKSVLAYDEAGNPSLKVTAMADGRLVEVTLFIANARNLLSAKILFNENGAFNQKLEYGYDNTNKLILTDSHPYEVRNVYRSNVLAQQHWYHKTFKQVETIIEFNERGDLVLEKHFTYDGTPLRETSYSYEYDASGNWIRQARSHFIVKEGKRVPDGNSTATRTIDYYPD
jgi:hypothetical protein